MLCTTSVHVPNYYFLILPSLTGTLTPTQSSYIICLPSHISMTPSPLKHTVPPTAPPPLTYTKCLHHLYLMPPYPIHNFASVTFTKPPDIKDDYHNLFILPLPLPMYILSSDLCPHHLCLMSSPCVRKYPITSVSSPLSLNI